MREPKNSTDLIYLNDKWTGHDTIDNMVYAILEDAIISFDFFDNIDFRIEPDAIYFGFEQFCESDIYCIVRMDENTMTQYCGNFYIEQEELDDFYRKHDKICESIFLLMNNIKPRKEEYETD